MLLISKNCSNTFLERSYMYASPCEIHRTDTFCNLFMKPDKALQGAVVGPLLINLC